MSKIPDLFTAAKSAGLTTASIFWPVTGNHRDVDYLINEWPGCAPDIPIAEAMKEEGSDQKTLDIVKMYEKEMLRTGVHPGCDYFVADCAAEIIKRYTPDLVILHPANVDGARHASGVFSDAVEQAVKETDDMIGIVCRAAEAAGLGGKYNFVLVSDHGQLDMKRIVNVNALFADLGWIETDSRGNVKDWKAWAISQGFSSYVVLRDPCDSDFKEKAERTLRELIKDGLYGFGSVLNEGRLANVTAFTENFLLLLKRTDLPDSETIINIRLYRYKDMILRIIGKAGLRTAYARKGASTRFLCQGPCFQGELYRCRG